MKRIAILDLNPGVDRVIYLDSPMQPGAMNRAANTVFCSGSKAANQVILWSGLGGVEIDYITFAGGPLGDACLGFTRLAGVTRHTVTTAAGIRVNTKVIDGAGITTELNERGGPVCAEELARLKTLLAEVCGKVDILSLAGSIPQGVEKDVYKRILSAGLARETVLDCDGLALELAITASPGLIKPNRYELMGLAEALGCLHEPYLFRDFSTVPPDGRECAEICAAVRGKLEGMGIKPPDMLCTLDKMGSVFVDRGGAWFASAPEVEAKSFSGAGDCYLATFVHARRVLGLSLPDAMRRAAATAAAKVATVGMAMPEAGAVEHLCAFVEVTRL